MEKVLEYPRAPKGDIALVTVTHEQLRALWHDGYTYKDRFLDFVEQDNIERKALGLPVCEIQRLGSRGGFICGGEEMGRPHFLNYEKQAGKIFHRRLMAKHMHTIAACRYLTGRYWKHDVNVLTLFFPSEEGDVDFLEAFDLIRRDVLTSEGWFRRVCRFALWKVYLIKRRQQTHHEELGTSNKVIEKYNEIKSAIIRTPRWCRGLNPEMIFNALGSLKGTGCGPALIERRWKLASLQMLQESKDRKSYHPWGGSAVLIEKMTMMNAERIVALLRKARREGIFLSTHSYSTPTRLLSWIDDGKNINTDLRGVAETKPVDLERMSLTELVAASGWNHRASEAYEAQCNKAAESDPTPLAVPEMPPEPIEEYRIKTVGEIVKAGRECHHCISNYRHRTDSFFYRVGSVCAQVVGRKVVQCYDAHNEITTASKKVEKMLAAAFRKEVEE